MENPDHAVAIDQPLETEVSDATQTYEPLRITTQFTFGDSGEQVPEHETATRIIVRAEVKMDNEGPVVVFYETQYRAIVNWSQDLLNLALTDDIRDVVAIGINVFLDNNLLDKFTSTSEMRAERWSGWEDVRKHATFKLKNSEKVISRVDRLDKLIAERRALGVDLVSASTKLRVQRDTSPIPHGETGEMNFGSTTEINETAARVNTLSAAIDEKTVAIFAQIAKINETFGAPSDTGWQVVLPELVSEITRLNTPISKEYYAKLRGLVD